MIRPLQERDIASSARMIFSWTKLSIAEHNSDLACSKEMSGKQEIREKEGKREEKWGES